MFGSSRPDRLFARFVASGNVRALGAVFDATAPELLRIATHLVGAREQAFDLVQSAFLIAIEKRAEFAVHRRVLPWLCGIVANLARNERRRAQRVLVAAPPAPAEDPAAAAEASEFRAAFLQAKAGLPEVYRPVLELHLEHGLMAEAIGSVLGRPAGTVRTQIVRGLELLRRRLPKGFVAGLSTVTWNLDALRSARANVLARAAEQMPVTASVTAVAGTMAWWWIGVGAMNNKFVLLGALALLSLGLWSLGAPASPPVVPAARPADGASPLSAPIASAGDVVTPANELSNAREAAPQPTSAAAEHGSLAVTVRWQHGDAPASDQAIEVVYADELAGALHPHRIVTDQDGQAVFTALRPGAISVWSSTGLRRAATITAGQRSEMTLALEGIPVLGQVIDHRGEAVAGADIWVSSEVRYAGLRRSEAAGHGQHGQSTLRSDAQGRFLTRLAGAQCLAAFHAGHGPSNTIYPVLGTGHSSDRPVEVTLQLHASGGTLAVTVKGPRGHAVAGALILVGEEIPTLLVGEAYQATAPALRATTDAEGTALLTRLLAARLPVIVRAAGFGPWWGEVDIPAAGIAQLQVSLPEGAVLEGAVFDADGNPLASALLRHGPVSSLRASVAITDARGAYRLDDLPTGEGTVVAFQEAWGEVTHRVQLVAGETQRWDVRMPPRAVITGVVLDHEGRPAAGANVLAFANQGGHANGIADAAGRFTVGPLIPTRAYELRAEFRVKDALAVVQRAAVPAGAHVELRALAEQLPTARLRGRVLQHDGAPAVGFVLCTTPLDGMPGTEVAIGAQGEFALGPWPPDRVRLTVERSGSRQALAYFGVHEMRADSTHDVGDLMLPAFGGARVRVLGSEQPGQVMLYRDDVTMDTRGFTSASLAWRELAPGHYTVCVTRGGESPSCGVVEFDVTAERTVDIDLTVVPVARRELRLVLPGGGAKGPVLLRAIDASGRCVMVAELPGLPDGQARRIGLPASAVEVRGLCASGHGGRVALDGAAGAAIQLELLPSGR